MSMNKTLGIMCYIDNNPTMLEDFSWLYKSWIHSGNWLTSDLLVVHHPDAGAHLPRGEAGVITVPCLPVAVPGSVFEGYPFINSIACLSGPHIDSIARPYPCLLRTDADVFLTGNLKDFRPSFAVHGCGNYHWTEEFREGMLDFCRRHGVTHMNHFGCGHSFLGPAELVMHMVKRQTYWTEMFLKDFGDKTGAWPGWYRGVSTMYAAEVLANESFGAFLANGRERILDVYSYGVGPIEKLVYHIHAIHTYDYFSKFHFREGRYSQIDVETLNLGVIREYCHWIAAADIDRIKELANYPG